MLFMWLKPLILYSYHERLRQVKMPTVNFNQGHAAFTNHFVCSQLKETLWMRSTQASLLLLLMKKTEALIYGWILCADCGFFPGMGSLIVVSLQKLYIESSLGRVLGTGWIFLILAELEM